jgi:uncharacterized protein (TIGR02246 family)
MRSQRESSLRLIWLILVPVAIAGLSSSCTSTDKARSDSAQSAAPTADSGAAVELQVRQLLQEYDQAWLQQDAAAFDRLLAEDYTIVEIDGNVLSKADVIANAKSGDLKFESGQSDDIKIRVSGNTAVINGRWTEKSTMKGKPLFDGPMRFTTVAVKKDGRWQFISEQVTPIIAKKANA